MLRHQRDLEHGYNHTRHDLGSMPGYGRVDLEDGLIQALEDTLYDQRVSYFRDFVSRSGRDLGLPSEAREAILHNDRAAWFYCYAFCCQFRRMVHRWEFAANKLMWDYGLDPSEIPDGKACLDT